MKIQNAFLCFGTHLQPCVVLLSESEKAYLDDRLRIATKHNNDQYRLDAYKQAFRVDAEWAIPCWSEPALLALAHDYNGVHADKVKGLCACMLTGTPYGGSEYNDDDDIEGGEHITLPIPSPVTPKGGAAVQMLFGSAA